MRSDRFVGGAPVVRQGTRALGGAPTYPDESGIRVSCSSCGLQYLWSCYHYPRYEASRAPLGHAQAYRNVLNDALTALSVINALVGFGPFSSGCRRMTAFVTRMGDFCANLVRPRSNHFRSVMIGLPERSVKDFGFVVVDCFSRFFLLYFLLAGRVCFVPRVFVLNSLTLHRRGRFGVLCLVETWILRLVLYIRKSNYVFFALAHFTRSSLVQRTTQGVLRVGDTQFRESSHRHAGVRRVGWAHSPVGGVTVQMTPVAGGQGHAPFVGAIACDLSWREGRSLVFGVQRGSREVFLVSIVVVWDSDCLFVGYFLQWEKGNNEGANYVRNFNERAQGIELAW
ncbi:hypothetical protein CRG98_003113 [Punica granatum]|uniref:Uncharacterized protein n=1 Tax=Punica granatum TaxID=22663 RepID=A0A2I0L718_PUNGR|nr:hypothetical protein CRG98_003113 [Punica granatum]